MNEENQPEPQEKHTTQEKKRPTIQLTPTITQQPLTKTNRKIKCLHIGCKNKPFRRGHCFKHYKKIPRLKPLKDGPLLTYEETKKRILSIESEYYRTLFILLYVLGNRASEVIELKKNNFFAEKHPTTGEKHLYVVSPVRKNRQSHTKHFPINIRKENHYFTKIRDWVKQIPGENDWIFPSPYKTNKHISYSSLQQQCQKIFGFNSHWFRKLRTTHELNGSVPETPPIPTHIIKRLRGWTDDRPLKFYEKWMYTDTSKFI